MSTSKVRKELSDKLLQVFLKEETDATRTELQNSRPQVVFIQDLEWLGITLLLILRKQERLGLKNKKTGCQGIIKILHKLRS